MGLFKVQLPGTQEFVNPAGVATDHFERGLEANFREGIRVEELDRIDRGAASVGLLDFRQEAALIDLINPGAGVSWCAGA